MGLNATFFISLETKSLASIAQGKSVIDIFRMSKRMRVNGREKWTGEKERTFPVSLEA